MHLRKTLILGTAYFKMFQSEGAYEEGHLKLPVLY